MGECFPVGAAAGCDLLILIFDNVEGGEDQEQKIAAFGSSYIDRVHRQYRGRTKIPVGAAAGCDLLILTMSKGRKIKIKDRSLRQLLQGSAFSRRAGSP
jgi:hypothetical protein